MQERTSYWPLAAVAGVGVGAWLMTRSMRRAAAAPVPIESSSSAEGDAVANADLVSASIAPPSIAPPIAPPPIAPPPIAPPPIAPPPIAPPSIAPVALPLPPFVSTVLGAAAAPWAPSSIAPPPPIAPTAPPPVPPAVTAAPSATPVPTGWVWPLLAWNGRNPVISDGWGSPRDGGTRMHRGADVMYRRRWESELLSTYPARAPHSKWHFMPAGTLVVAAGDGVIWSAGRTDRGFAIVIDHGRPWATFYQHLSALLVPARAGGPGGMRVRAGQPIGIVGADPTSPPGHEIAHLHFEIWRGGDGSTAIDPQPILTRLPVLLAPTVGASTAPPVRPLDRIYAEHGRGIPVPYLRALAVAESGENVNDPHGVINVVQVALADYNRRHMSAPVSEGDLRRPEVSVKVAADILRTIIDGYRRFHPDVPNLRENWQNPEFVGLLTAGWNAGASEARGVGRVASYIRTLGGDVTLANVWKLAKDAGASPHLSNPGKLAFATKVRDAYVAATRAGAPS